MYIYCGVLPVATALVWSKAVHQHCLELPGARALQACFDDFSLFLQPFSPAGLRNGANCVSVRSSNRSYSKILPLGRADIAVSPAPIGQF